MSEPNSDQVTIDAAIQVLNAHYEQHIADLERRLAAAEDALRDDREAFEEIAGLSGRSSHLQMVQDYRKLASERLEALSTLVQEQQA